MPQFWFLLSVSILVMLCKVILSKLTISSVKEKKSFDLKVGFGLMCLFLFIARIFWTYLDFYLTQFNTHEIYESFLNGAIYKTATIFIGLGLLSFIWSIEKSELNMKLKGIPSISLLVLLIIMIFSPLENLIDFNRIAKLQLYMNLFGLLIPILLVVKGFSKKSKKYYILAAAGTVIYALGANLLNEVIMMAMRNSFGNIALYINYSLLLLFKSAGLIIMYLSVKSINNQNK